MRRLWRAVYGRIVLMHADYWTGFERLRTKYTPPPPKSSGPSQTIAGDPNAFVEGGPN